MPLSKFLPWGLYVGGRYDAENFDNLIKERISYIVSAGTKDITFPSHFEVLRIRIKDRIGEKFLDRFEEVKNFVDSAKEANEQVLIHCDVGQSRSCAFAIAYSLVRESTPLWATLQELKLMRRKVQRDVKVNSSFMKELMDLEYKVLGASSIPSDEIEKILERLKKRGFY